MVWKQKLAQRLCVLLIVSFAAQVCRPASAALSASGSTSANPTTAGASPVIGVDDIGRLTINAGSSLSSNNSILGDATTGIGLVTVTDFNSGTGSASTWAMNSLLVGDEGTGRLEILNGAVVTIDVAGSPGTGDVIIGTAATSVGTVIVNGLGTIVHTGDETTVGLNGTGILRVENEGYFIATNDKAGDTDVFTVGALGRVEFAGNGRLRAQSFTSNGVVVGDGRIDSAGTITNSTTGHFEAGVGQRLTVNAVFSNQGEIAANGGQLEFFKAVTSSNAAAEVTLRDGGSVVFPTTGFGYDSTSGTLASTAGVNDVYGTVRIQGTNSKIVVAGESTAVFHDAVTNTGGTIDVFPGSSVVYLGGLTTTGSGAVLSIHLADPNHEFDLGQVEVNGVAQLAGNLTISLGPGFVPSAGDAFQVLTAGSVTGTLGLGAAPPLVGGMQWDIDINATNVMLSVVATGDYNANGVVDAADYVLWRNTVGAMGAGLAADGNGNGVVDAADYEFWRARFGNVVAGAAAATTSAVPEAVGVAPLLIGTIGALSRKRLTARGRRRVRMLQ